MSKKDRFRTTAQGRVDKVIDSATSPVEGTPELSREHFESAKRMRNARIITIDKIQPDPNQPRKTFDQNSIQELANSIREHGVLQPITVEYIAEEDYYKIISGERRYHASRLAGLDSMPCIVFDGVDSKDRYAKQLIENIQREDFTPIDKARALLEYKDMLGPDSVWAEVEKRVGISDRRRKQFIELLNLPADIQKQIVAIGTRQKENVITEKHARALLLLNKDSERQLELFEMIKNSETPMTGDEALTLAREIRDKNKIPVYTFKVKYETEKELIEILRKTLVELEAKYQQNEF